MKLELILGIWGTATGTAACLYNWFHDRGRLKVTASMSIVSTNIPGQLRPVLTITAVNIGHRPVNIKGAGALLSKTQMPPTPKGLSEEATAELQKKMVCNELRCRSGNLVLEGDGGHKEWEVALMPQVKFESRSKGKDTIGKAFVELTTGKKIFCDFYVIPEEDWPN